MHSERREQCTKDGKEASEGLIKGVAGRETVDTLSQVAVRISTADTVRPLG